MPVVSNTNNMSSRAFLNNHIESLFIKDIKDNYDALVAVKEDRESHLLVEKYWIVLNKVLNDCDAIGFGENENIRDVAIETSLLMIDAFVETIFLNNVPEADLQEYCIYQIDMVMDVVKRYGIDEEYRERLAGTLTKYMRNYVDELRNLAFEEFYNYTKRLGIEKYSKYVDFTMYELGIILYSNLIESYVQKFKSDPNPELRLYIEELSHLVEKAHSYEFISSQIANKIVYTCVDLVEGGMEKKYFEKEVIREVTKQIIALLTKYDLMNDCFWNALTDIFTIYMKMMTEKDERENFKFYWLFSQEIEILDRVGQVPDKTAGIEVKRGEASSISKSGAKKSASKSAAPAKAAKKRKSGGLREL
ncbi:MAG: hypothetical protein JXK07_01970 [Spirochaetes bacterium]|nr:hypothetical protein [Spirochaetota bacterium]MBN2769955.1 hypothetical protein [Spirochaetota bacterium]